MKVVMVHKTEFCKLLRFDIISLEGWLLFSFRGGETQLLFCLLLQGFLAVLHRGDICWERPKWNIWNDGCCLSALLRESMACARGGNPGWLMACGSPGRHLLSFLSEEPDSSARFTEPQKLARMSLYIQISQLGLQCTAPKSLGGCVK